MNRVLAVFWFRRRVTGYGFAPLCAVFALVWLFLPRAYGQSLNEWAEKNQQWLERQTVPNGLVPEPDPTRRRLLMSLELSPVKFPRNFHRSAIYDDALGALALIAGGRTDEPAFILHAISRLVRADGSLWFGYNTANSWPDESDHSGALIRAGALGWVGYSLTFYLTIAPPCPAADKGCTRERAAFLATAIRLAKYLRSLEIRDQNHPAHGLVRLGYGDTSLRYDPKSKTVIESYKDEPAPGVSTENNISAWFFLRHLGQLTHDSEWTSAADRIRDALLRAAWEEKEGRFDQGFFASGARDSRKALDCASWGALFFMAIGENEKARRALESAELFLSRDGAAAGYSPYYDQQIYPDAEVGGFYFPQNPSRQWRELPLVWSEGSLGVALAYLRSGDAARCRQILENLKPLQVSGSALRYASTDVPHFMSDAPGVAAASWLVLVTQALAGNPAMEEFWR